MLYNTTFKIPKKFAVSMHYKLYIYLDPFTNMSRLCHICTSKLEISIVLYITVKPIFCCQHGYKHKNIRLNLLQVEFRSSIYWILIGQKVTTKSITMKMKLRSDYDSKSCLLSS